MQQLKGYYAIYNELRYIPLGVEVNNNNLIVVDNMNGKVYFHDMEVEKKQYVAENLGDFINGISFGK